MVLVVMWVGWLFSVLFVVDGVVTVVAFVGWLFSVLFFGYERDAQCFIIFLPCHWGVHLGIAEAAYCLSSENIRFAQPTCTEKSGNRFGCNWDFWKSSSS